VPVCATFPDFHSDVVRVPHAIVFFERNCIELANADAVRLANHHTVNLTHSYAIQLAYSDTLEFEHAHVIKLTHSYAI